MNGNIAPNGTLVGFTSPRLAPPVIFNPPKEPAQYDRVWVGVQTTRAQAEEAWEALGAPADKEVVIARLLTLEPGQAIMRDTNGRIGVIELHLPARICIEGALGEVVVVEEAS